MQEALAGDVQHPVIQRCDIEIRRRPVIPLGLVRFLGRHSATSPAPGSARCIPAHTLRDLKLFVAKVRRSHDRSAGSDITSGWT